MRINRSIMCTSYILIFLFSLSLGASLEPYSFRHLRENPLFPHGRIVGGKDTKIEEVPYQVALEYYSLQFCGGALISKRHVLTAAHCIFAKGLQIQVRMGSTLRHKGGVTILSRVAEVHPEYSDENLDNDIAVIELENDVKVSDSVKPIPIIYSEPNSNMKMKLSGWGSLDENGVSSAVLQYVEIPVIDRKLCEEMYNNIPINITSRMICAYENGKDSCQGDSGGPGVVDGKLAGIVSWGVGCARPEYPGVYTNVADPKMRAFVREYANV